MIPDNFTDAYAQVKNLVRRFNASEKDYLSADYQEANVRQEFLDKFFVALGWDVYHERQTNPYQREVRIEKSIQVEGRGKRADYALFVAPNFQQTRFIAEDVEHSTADESRFKMLAMAGEKNLVVVYTMRGENFRIISARKAEKYERELYEKRRSEDFGE